MFQLPQEFLFLKQKNNEILNNMRKFIQLLSFLLSLLLYGCAGTSKKVASKTSYKSQLETEFQRYKNTPYKYGGTDRHGFDCSGFVKTVYQNAFQIELPRTTGGMSKIGTKIKREHLKIGDLVFFRPSKSYMHVGVYVGNNQFIHSSTSKGVIKSSLDNVYWTKKYRFARRILKQ